MTQQLIQRGQAAINSGNMLEAAQWFERALEINPKDSQSLACFGQSQCWLGQKKQGLVNLREAGRLIARASKKSKDINDLISMVGQLQYWNDFAGALELARQAVQIGKNDVRSFQMLASSYARLNKKQQAISACQQALRLAPKNVELNILMADLDAREKKYFQARQRLEKILLMDLSAEQIFRAEKELANILDKMG
ncbi:MAG: tetratricopeptide repeat protein [Methylococcaceae bacterium]